ncbi:MAG: hypothetical protein IPK32_14020 [Verrucomicrobiaceae bacterium]|nr:hypothetical protein [Verrucomicrobiaceae bacterium]
MSDKHQRNTLFIMGILGLLGTIAVQVLGVGEMKGEVMTLLRLHSSELVSLQESDRQQDREISEIKGKLHGIASQVGQVPSRVAAKLTGKESDR